MILMWKRHENKEIINVYSIHLSIHLNEHLSTNREKKNISVLKIFRNILFWSLKNCFIQPMYHDPSSFWILLKRFKHGNQPVKIVLRGETYYDCVTEMKLFINASTISKHNCISQEKAQPLYKFHSSNT